MPNNLLNEHLIDAAARGNPDLKRVLAGLHNDLKDTNRYVGKPQSSDHTATKGTLSIAPPGKPQWQLAGLDGKFIIVITPLAQTQPLSVAHRLRLRKPHLPLINHNVKLAQDSPVFDNDIDFQPKHGINLQQTQVLYQLQSATTSLFDAAGGVLTYGPDPKTVWEIQDPQQTKFWRIRSKFINSDWSAWYPYVDTILCGVVAISSGAMRSSSIYGNAVFNSTNFATVDSIDAGGSATIRVYGTGGVGSSWLQRIGATNFGPFAAASLTGFSYATFYYVTWTGAAYLVTPNLPDILVDTYHFAGQLTTVSAGGGGGSIGGGGSGGGSGGSGSGQKK